jgi:hypothetical protein
MENHTLTKKSDRTLSLSLKGQDPEIQGVEKDIVRVGVGVPALAAKVRLKTRSNERCAGENESHSGTEYGGYRFNLFRPVCRIVVVRSRI